VPRSDTAHLRLFREFAQLERQRTSDGVTPLEYQRWLDLRGRLARRFRTTSGPPDDDPARDAADATRLRVDFKTPEDFRDAWIGDLARGGVFVPTPFAAEIGSVFDLRIHVATGDASGAPVEVLEVLGEVATNNVADGFTTDRLGMGIHFQRLAPEQRLVLDALLSRAAAARAGGRG